MKRFFNHLLGIVYSPKCVACGEATSGESLCENCSSSIHLLRTNVSAQVQKYYSRLWSLAAYEGPWMEVIHKLKYGRGRAAVGVVSGLLKTHIASFDDIDCIVPVPLNSRRYIKRGYNQSVIIARMVSELIDRPFWGRALIRSRHTSPQVGKSLSERKENLKSAFTRPRFMAQDISEKNVLLIDDVVTSGATIDECAKVLMNAGAGRVDVLTLAKTL